MTLKIQIRPGEKTIINGAVLENGGKKTISLLVRNQASLLRQHDVLPPDKALTPAACAYYALQCAYVFPAERERYLAYFNGLLREFLTAVPSALPLGIAINQALQDRDLFKALKAARDLIVYEGRILRHAQQCHAQEVQHAPPAGRPPED